MFFEPPKVKSLSRYSEFGVNLSHYYFTIMLLTAFVVHALVLGIYAMMPHQQVMRIPVRVINIKLGGSGGVPAIEMPHPSVAGGPDGNDRAPLLKEITIKPNTSDPMEAQREKAVQSVFDKAFVHADAPPPAPKTPKPKADDDKDTAEKTEPTLATPKQYIRANNVMKTLPGTGGGRGGGHGSGTGTGQGDVSGKGGGEAAVQRYEQTISLWMARHKIYPEKARSDGTEGSAIVRIRINREGHVLSSSIDQGSGSDLIDEAALAMVRASDPVPRVPDNYPAGGEFEFLIPVNFKLQ